MASIKINHHYNLLCDRAGDINEHLPTLLNYASKCESVLELGVRGCVSSWAFASGLIENGLEKKELILNNKEVCDVNYFLGLCGDIELGLNVKYKWINDLEWDVSNINVDLLFIDTWHVYPQLKKELEIFSKITNKYIIMHDTEIDGEQGESIRLGSDITRQSNESGFKVEDIACGLHKAIYEFLTNNTDWAFLEHFENNNGLMILKRHGIY